MATVTSLQTCILVVEDFAPFRRFIIATLQAKRGWHIIAEASNGFEAVQKAEGLQPDLILLDIGLPKLNGIEAAKIINRRCPKSKILFVTQDGDDDVRDAAMRTGATGYVLKANAENELLDAITTALSH